jgi:hypothetical protein
VAAAGHLLQFSRLALPLLRGGKVPSPAGLYIASTPLLPAVVGLLLAEAAREDRLASFTYRRLSLSLALSVLPPLAFAATRLSGVARASVLLTSLLTLVAALKSWAYGARGWSLSTSTYHKELAAGARQILAGLLPGYNSLKLNPARWPSSAAYLLSAYFLIFVTLQNLLPSPAPLAIRAWRMSRLQLLSTIAFCLKDAADRGRLAGERAATPRASERSERQASEASAKKAHPSAAETGSPGERKRAGGSGTPRPTPATDDDERGAPTPTRVAAALLRQKRASERVVGGRPPEPPLRPARLHTCSAAHVLHTCLLLNHLLPLHSLRSPPLAGSTFVRLNALLVVTSAPYAWVLVSGVGPISNPLWGAAFGAIAGLGAVQCLRQVLAKKLQQ